MVSLTSDTVIQSVEQRIREFIPDVDIRRWMPNGGQNFVTRPLNVYTERDAFDLNDESAYPYIFVDELDVSRSYFNAGFADKYYFTYSFALGYYVDINPTDVSSIPRINEELRAMRRKLLTFFDRIDILGDIYHVIISPPSSTSEGILHFFIRIEDVPEYVYPDPVEKVESLTMDMELHGK